MKTFRSAIVGCGGIAKVHAACLAHLPQTQLIACADIRPERAQAMADEHGATAYDRLESMLAGQAIDVLHITTPHALHLPMAQAAAERGIAVFTEKPPVTNREQWAQMHQIAEKVPLGICFQNRYNDTTTCLRDQLAAGTWGKVLGARAVVTWCRSAPYYTDSGWRGTWALEGGGALINQSIHTLDLMIYLLGSVTGVQSHMANFHLPGVIEVEDTVTARVAFAGGANGLFYATTAYATDAPVMLEIACEGGTLRLEDNIVTLTGGGRTQTIAFDQTPAMGQSYWGNSHLAAIGNYYRALEENTPPPIGVAQVEDTMEIVLSMYEQNRDKL